MHLSNAIRRALSPSLPLLPSSHRSTLPDLAGDMADFDDVSPLLPIPLPMPFLLPSPPQQDRVRQQEQQQPRPPQPDPADLPPQLPQQPPTEIWDLPPVNPLNPNRPHYRLHPRPTTLPQQQQQQAADAAEKWRVPTILVLTLTITLGVAMIFFLTWVAYRKIKQLRELRRRELMDRQEMSMRI